MNILVTGGCGFIGSALVRYLVHQTDHTVINLDKLTYAASLEAVGCCASSPRYFFEKGDICDNTFIGSILKKYTPQIIIHLAAESHVDNSITGPSEFIQTNIIGTYTLLQNALVYYKNLTSADKENFRFHHVSTDEVFGELDDHGLFSETTSYDPSSPYSVSKACSDHLVRAWGRTYGLPYSISNCTNNYGPFQFREKMIPTMILNCFEKKSLPVYGKGENVRDWLYVEDHVEAIYKIVTSSKLGETYCIGGEEEKKNIEVVHTICKLMNESLPWNNGEKDYSTLITYVTDRPGHDYRYAMDITKIKQDLLWKPKVSFEEGIRKTIRWYLENANELRKAA